MAPGGHRPGFDRVFGNAADAQRPKQLTRGCHGAIDVNAAASVLDHDRFETFAPRIFRRITHAEIARREPDLAATVPFVLWFNFVAGFAYVMAGVGLFLWKR